MDVNPAFSISENTVLTIFIEQDNADYQFIGSCFSSADTVAAPPIQQVNSTCSISSDLQSITFNNYQPIVSGTKFRIKTKIQNPIYFKSTKIKAYITSTTGTIIDYLDNNK